MYIMIFITTKVLFYFKFLRLAKKSLSLKQNGPVNTIL